MEKDEVVALWEILAKFETAMLVTQRGDGQPRARPMALVSVEPNCDLWFFTGRGSAKVDEIRRDQHVLVICQQERSRYVALSGVAELISDRTRAAELWRETHRTWFPDGPNDPELLLIYVRSERAEYWDNAGFKAVEYVLQAAKAYVTGTRQQVEEGRQHGTVDLK